MFQVEHRANASIVHVSGELDVASSPALDSIIKLLEGRRTQRIVVSLEGCSYCYAVGLSVLVAAKNRIDQNFFVVVPVAAPFRRIFEITGLSKVLQLLPTVQSALSSGEAELVMHATPKAATEGKRSNVLQLARSA